MRHESFDLTRSITILGAPFTFRTFHGPDGRYADQYENHMSRLDRVITVTLAAVHGIDHHEAATMLVTL